MFAKLPQDGGRLTYIFTEHPTEMGGAALFNVKRANRIGGTDGYAFRRDATIYSTEKSAENNLGEDLLGGMGQLHFGWFGGGVVKIVYGALGLGLTYLAASGDNIWLARRRDKGRPAPGWERAWSATVWGQPAGIAAAALTSLFTTSLTPVILLWLIVAFLLLLLALRLDADRLAMLARALTGIFLLSTALVHAFGHGGGDRVAWLVDIVCGIGGLALVLPTMRRARRRTPAVSGV